MIVRILIALIAHTMIASWRVACKPSLSVGGIKRTRNITDRSREITERRFESISHVVMNASIVCL